MYSSFYNIHKKTFGREVLKKLNLIIQSLINDPDSYQFRNPVDWKTLKIPDYPQIIKNPMDLGTVKQKITDMKYKDVKQVLNDIQLIWDNCLNYNPQGIWIYKIAQKLQIKFNKLVKNYFPENETQDQILYGQLFPLNHRKVQHESSTKQSFPIQFKKIEIIPEIIRPTNNQKIKFQQKLKILSPENLKMIINDIRELSPSVLCQYTNGSIQINCEQFTTSTFDNIMQKLENLIQAQQHIQYFLMRRNRF